VNDGSTSFTMRIVNIFRPQPLLLLSLRRVTCHLWEILWTNGGRTALQHLWGLPLSLLRACRSCSKSTTVST
jgi:hypothetical protein